MTTHTYLGVGGAVAGGSATTAKVDAILVKPPKPPRWRPRFKLPRITMTGAIDWLLRIGGIYELGRLIGLWRKAVRL